MGFRPPEILPFPLYHGTSSVWQASILRHGLGGRNIVEEFRAVGCLKDAVSYLEALPLQRQPDRCELDAYRSLASQAVTGIRVNFRHGGGVYLTPSRATAARYARANRAGSEVISTCHKLRSDYGLDHLANGYPELFSLPLTGKPMLVIIDSVRICDLSTETGDADFRELQFLLEQISESKKNVREQEVFRRRAREGDADAIRELLTGSSQGGLGEQQTIEAYGQQINCQARVVFPAAELVVEEISAE